MCHMQAVSLENIFAGFIKSIQQIWVHIAHLWYHFGIVGSQSCRQVFHMYSSTVALGQRHDFLHVAWCGPEINTLN